ncbi:MAG: T9SS type A sorting domain-containing protein [Bacteroidales bacterium]|nr:T9SS type A sorting domain-containing protein [Bacteroidales bacterium]
MLDVVKSGQGTILLENGESVNMPYSSNWVYFVDDRPFANWAHPCRYIFVNESTGAYQIVNKDFFPVDWKKAYTAISEMTRSTPVDLPVNPNATINGLDPNPNLYAVIINGADQDRYWNDISAIYCTLLDVYGYTKENIFIHYVNSSSVFGADFDNDGADDIDYNAYKTSIHHTFQEMSGETNTSPEIPELGPEDGLFIFVDDHGYMSGGHSYINLPGDDLGDFELAQYLEDINCAQIIAVLEPCQIGGFEVELSDFVNYNVNCKNRSIQTASDDESSWAEIWITGANYDEFVYYWTAAARGYYPHNDYPWEESHEVGLFPFYNYPEMVGHPGDHNPDLDGDGFVQMEEAFDYANNLDTWSSYGYYYPKYTGYDPEDPQEFTDISFNEDLLSLCGISGNVENTQSVQGNFLVGGELIIDPGVSLTLEDGLGLYFGNNLADLLVDPGANLIIEDDVIFLGNNNNSIQINGNIQVGQNVTIGNNSTSSSFGGLYLNNNALQTSFTGTTFTKSDFHNYGASLTMNNCTFNDCHWVYSHRGNVTVNNSTLLETWLYLENQVNDPNLIATVSGCTISNTNMHVGVDLWNYGKYFIENNNIKAYHNGIQICNSGNGNTGNQSIYGNNIHDCNQTGILAYDATGSIAGNNIHNNQIGLSLMNNCNVALFGNPGAQTYAQTQQIKDNTSYEVYASKYSFPWYFRYNAIIDEDNAGNPYDPLLYFAYPAGSTRINQKDIRYNCWGDNFDASEDFYPSTYFIYNPTWCPGGGGIVPDPIIDMYTSALEQFENGNYTVAKNLFQLFIQQYPKSDYTQAAMKELLRLEEYVAADYSGLKEYYQTNDSIAADTVLVKLGDILANKCDVKLENWPLAISWYENKITNPSCLEDSVFAIIDLGYVYFLMENQGLKSTYTGNLKQFKPESKEKYFEHRDYLLSLLPGETMSEKLHQNLTNIAYGSLLQNVPNPFSENTQIWYKIEKQVHVTISITDLTGKEMRQINEGIKDKGTYKVDFTNSDLISGTYFYSLLFNGKLSDTKKMSIIR